MTLMEDPTDVKSVVLAAIRAVLADSTIEVEDNFYVSGGDSILALRVLEEAARSGVDVDLMSLLTADSIDDIEVSISSSPQPPISPLSELVEVPEGDRARAWSASALQIGLMFMSDVADNDAGAYQDFFGGRFRPYDEQAFQRTLDQLILRHEVLRTSFDLLAPKEPTQVVNPHVRLVPEVLTVREPDVAEVRASWQRQVTKDGLDLAKAPIMRCLVLTDGDIGWCTFATHHSLLDGWSHSRFMVELATLYDAEISGRAVQTPVPPNGTSAEFVRLETEAVRSPQTSAFWKQELAQLRPARRQDNVSHAATRQVVLDLPDALLTGVEEVAARLRVPVRSVYLAAHLRALSAESPIETPTTGLVVNGRPPSPGADLAMGLFLNTIPMTLPAGGSFDDLIERTFRKEMQLFEHRRYPLAEMVRELRGQPFSSTFNFTHFHSLRQIERLPAAVFDSLWDVGIATYPLMVDICIEDPLLGTSVVVNFDPDLFNESDADRIGQRITTTLKSIAGISA